MIGIAYGVLELRYGCLSLGKNKNDLGHNTTETVFVWTSPQPSPKGEGVCSSPSGEAGRGQMKNSLGDYVSETVFVCFITSYGEMNLVSLAAKTFPAEP